MNGWPVFALRDVAEIASGITLGRKARETELVDVPYMRVANVKDGVLDLSEIKTVAATAREIEKWTLRDGDLLLTEGGDLDKLGRGACWRNQLPICIHQNHIFRVRLPSDRYDPDFVSYQTSSAYGKAYFLAHAKKTTGIASINQRVLGAFPLFSPSLAEQRQISARLKAKLAEVETARQAAQAQVRETGSLKSKVIEAAFAGYENWRPIGSVAKVQSGYAFKSESFKTSGVRLLRNANIRPGEVYWDDVVFLNEEDARQVPSYVLAEGDVLISLDRPLIAGGIKVGRVSEADLPALLVQRVGRFLLNSEMLNADYLYAFLRSDHFVSQISGHEQSLGVPHISPAQVGAIELPLPSLNEQLKFVQHLKTQLAEVDALAQAATTQLAEIDRLPQRLLAQAFTTQGDVA